LKTKDVIKFCIRQRDLGRIFTGWSSSLLVVYIINKIRNNCLVTYIDRDEVKAVAIFDIDAQNKQVYIEQIVVDEKIKNKLYVLGKLFETGLYLKNLWPIPEDWKFIGTHKKSKRQRSIPLTLKTLFKLYNYGRLT
jgi:hypothetical protein